MTTADWGVPKLKLPREGTANNDIRPVKARHDDDSVPVMLTRYAGWSVDRRGLRFFGDWPEQRGRMLVPSNDGGAYLVDWRKAKKLRRKGLV